MKTVKFQVMFSGEILAFALLLRVPGEIRRLLTLLSLALQCPASKMGLL